MYYEQSVKHQYTASLEKGSKKIYDKQFTTVQLHTKIFKIITMKNAHIITHWNLLYALKIGNCLNFIQVAIY